MKVVLIVGTGIPLGLICQEDLERYGLRPVKFRYRTYTATRKKLTLPFFEARNSREFEWPDEVEASTALGAGSYAAP
jgi:hypothetical protein